jgi:nitrate reductase assembly molybdenum cofactor insertion protein NarJ
MMPSFSAIFSKNDGLCFIVPTKNAKKREKKKRMIDQEIKIAASIFRQNQFCCPVNLENPDHLPMVLIILWYSSNG